VAVGELVLGRFRLEERVGEGGFASVYRAWDSRLQRHVAVKVLDTGRSGERVMREAQAAARLNHRSIVTLYELGIESERAFLVSELIDGLPLRELVAEGGLSDRDAAVIGAELCEALEHAHERGVVHRDVKPENVLLARAEAGGAPWSRQRFGRAMLTDFGVASVRGADALTRSGEVLGTLAYMAPEQAEGAEVGPPADLYSLALTLYECWCGENPVRRSSPAETARAIGDEIAPLSEQRPDLPPPLSALLERCLDSEPSARPPAWEMHAALLDVAPELDDSRSLPLSDPRPAGDREGVGLWRVLAVFAAAAAVALAAIGTLPGLALVLAALVLPLPLLLRQPWAWLAPALAPILAALGLAPLFPAIAGLAGNPRDAGVLGLWGFAWLAVAQAAAGTSLPFGPVSTAPAGWESSTAEAASALFADLMQPEMLAIALSWTAGAATLAWLLRSGGPATRVIGLLVWAAVMITLHRLLPGWETSPETPTAIALALMLACALWLRASNSAWPPLPWRRRRSAAPAPGGSLSHPPAV
jgi:tRNA A-37 threonylcarbamoyl transferase component Bud32